MCTVANLCPVAQYYRPATRQSGLEDDGIGLMGFYNYTDGWETSTTTLTSIQWVMWLVSLVKPIIAIGHLGYLLMIHNCLNYAFALWGDENTRSKFVFRLQKRAMRIIILKKKPSRYSTIPTLKDHNILIFPCILVYVSIAFCPYKLSYFS